MPTRSGWATLGAGLACLAAGRVLGWVEGYLAGTGLVLLVVGAAAWARARRLDLAVTRSVEPDPVHLGSPARVRITVRNRGGRRTPVLLVRDGAGEGAAEALLAPVERGASTSIAHPVPTDRRGTWPVGPLSVVLEDAFGLARSTTRGLGRAKVTVLPHVPDLPAPPTVGAVVGGPSATGATDQGDEVQGLREYVVGDDPRRVHWPSSAHRDELLVRHFDDRRAGRVVIVLDTAVPPGPAFELAVTATAGLVVAACRRDAVALRTAAGVTLGPATGPDHARALLHHLAEVTATGSAHPSAAGPRPSPSPHPGGASVVTVIAGEDGLGPLAQLHLDVPGRPPGHAVARDVPDLARACAALARPSRRAEVVG